MCNLNKIIESVKSLLLALIVSFIFLVSFYSCDSILGPNYEKDLVGTWISEDGAVFFRFDSNGQLAFEDNYIRFASPWHVEDRDILMTKEYFFTPSQGELETPDVRYKIEIEGPALSLTNMEDGFVFNLRRTTPDVFIWQPSTPPEGIEFMLKEQFEKANKEEAPTWPPLPADFSGDFTMDMVTMKKLAGDSIALPLAGQFTALSILAVEDNGTVRLEDILLDGELADHRFKITIHALHSHAVEDAKGDYIMGDPNDAMVAWVWHDFHVQSSGAAALHILGLYDSGKLIGYTYDRTELAELGAGSLLPVFGATGWQVVKTDAPLTGEILQVDGGRHLHLLDMGGGRAGLVPAP